MILLLLLIPLLLLTLQLLLLQKITLCDITPLTKLVTMIKEILIDFILP